MVSTSNLTNLSKLYLIAREGVRTYSVPNLCPLTIDEGNTIVFAALTRSCKCARP